MTQLGLLCGQQHSLFKGNMPMTICTVLNIMIRCNPFIACLENRKTYGKIVFFIKCVSNFLCIFVQNIFMAAFLYKVKCFLRTYGVITVSGKQSNCLLFLLSTSLTIDDYVGGKYSTNGRSLFAMPDRKIPFQKLRHRWVNSIHIGLRKGGMWECRIYS